MKRLLLTLVAGLLAATGLLGASIWLIAEGVGGERHLGGPLAEQPIPADAVAARATRQDRARHPVAAPADTQILFGDLHVHTTYSGDAFVFSLPLIQGEGAHPPADACDFARFCAELDFWSINDHAEYLTPWQWQETKETIRECNRVAGDPRDPDLVSLLGWEWTQGARSGKRPHYGHKNVIFRDTEDDAVPTRPIGAGSAGLLGEVEISSLAWALVRAAITVGDLPDNLQPYLDFNAFAAEVRELPECSPGMPMRELPDHCLDSAETPAELFAKLDDWGFASLVIPHGTAWGIHAPPNATLAAQLDGSQHDPARQRLFEVYSGHGSGERYRQLVHVEHAADGSVRCPAPQGDFVPCCWQAGEIIGSRCADAAAATCAARVARARQSYAELWPRDTAAAVVPGATADDWAECGQLAGGFLPAFDYRPAMSAQLGLAARPRGSAAGAAAFRYGLIASSDNHKARAGAGYKEIGRKAFGDAWGFRQDWIDRLKPDPTGDPAEPLSPAEIGAVPGFVDPGSERNASYYYTAGLVAAHSSGRSREAIWEALVQRRVYGTSGPRILLWFDLDNAPGGIHPMGSEVAAFDAPPRFTARAVGSFEQLPGCPQHTLDRLSADRLERLCLGECYHPSDRRYPIERIEVVRIRPQVRGDEPIEHLIDDPWRVFECANTADGCSVTFEDPEWTPHREHLYYVRALQVPTLAINGDPMRCQRDADGRCAEARYCPASGDDFDPDDECLSPVRERAWSSPIWILPGKTLAADGR